MRAPGCTLRKRLRVTAWSCGRMWSCSPISSSCFSASGAPSSTISTAWVFASSAISPSMWLWTPRMFGASRRISSWTRTKSPQRFPASRRTISAQTASSGAIPCTTMRPCGKTALSGGSAASAVPRSSTMLFVSTIFVVLRAIGRCPAARPLRRTATGSKAPACPWWVC